MIYTNKFQIPPALAARLQEDTYDHIDDPKHYSVTELTSPPRMALLMRRHYTQIVRDVSERFFLWLGNLTHADINKADVNAIQEERLFVDMGDGYTVSGKADQWEEEAVTDGRCYTPINKLTENMSEWDRRLLDKRGAVIPVEDVNKVKVVSAPTGLITDWKLTSVWAVIRQDKKDWEQQLNFYAYLYREAGFPVTELRVYALLRDWRVGELRRSPRDYPPIPFLDKPIEMWEEGAARRELKAKIDYMKQYEKEADFNLPECSPEERWTRDEKWAVAKEGRKTALKLCESEMEAYSYIALQPKKIASICTVEHRPGVDMRCAEYCDAREFCDHWHDEVKED